jgi:Uncharacterized conserved protein
MGYNLPAMKEQGYTLAQASVISRIPLPAVHKLIERRLIRPRRVRVGGRMVRMLSREQLVYLRLESEGVRLFPMATRRQILRSIESAPETEAIVLPQGSAVHVRVEELRQEVDRELSQLALAREMVTSNPEIMGGTPVFRGTRIPVDLVADMLAQGASVQEILEGYPALKESQVKLAPLYLRSFPRRGRPSSRPWAKRKHFTPIQPIRSK